MKPQMTTFLLTLMIVALSGQISAQNSTAYIAKADAGTITSFQSILDTSALNGNANLQMLLTHNLNPDGNPGTKVDHVLGFRFQSMKWYLNTQDQSAFVPDTYYNVFIPGDDAYAWVHTSSASNIVNNYTVIDDGRINNNPNAKVFVANVLANYNDHINGVFYSISANKWCIYNQEGTSDAMEQNIDFNVIVPKANTDYETIVHTADGNNTSNHFTYLNHPDLNSNPDAIVFITQVWNPNGIQTGVYNNHNVGVEYNSNNKWRIYNEDLANIPLGASFNVMIFKNNNISIEESEVINRNVKIYPNPAKSGEKMMLEFDQQLVGTIAFEVYGLDGKIIYKESLEKNTAVMKHALNHNLPRGVYLLKVENQGNAGVQKMMIQ